MSTYTVEKLPGEPVVRLTVHEDYDPSEHARAAVEVVNRLLDDLGEPVFFIQDLTKMKIDFDDIVVGADATGRGDSATFHHPNIRQAITVTQDPIMRKVFEGMAEDMYGNIQMVICDTLGEAMDYIRNR